MANNTLSDFPVLTNPDAASVTHVQKELVDYQVTLPVLAPYLAQTAISGADEKTDPVDADMVGLMDSAASNVLKKFSWANFKAKLKTYFDALYPSVDGWVGLGLTLTYASADAPTFTATVPGDVTGVLSVGMKVKLTQTTVKYFIITAIAYGSPNTTITMYGGTDYTLTADAISSVYYSTMKAPHGFPMSPAKWTVEVVDTAQRSQAPATANQYYNLGSLSISMPIGVWDVYYTCSLYVQNAAGGACIVNITLSTSTSSATNLKLSGDIESPSTVAGPQHSITKSDVLTIASKTSYYLIAKTSITMDYLTLIGDRAYTVIKAKCAHL